MPQPLNKLDLERGCEVAIFEEVEANRLLDTYLAEGPVATPLQLGTRNRVDQLVDVLNMVDHLQAGCYRAEGQTSPGGG